MALEARRRKRRTTSHKRRRRSTSVFAASPRRVRRRRSAPMGELGAAKSYGGLIFQFLEAGAGGIAGRLVSGFLPSEMNMYFKAAAGAGISVLIATQLKRPIFASGMAATFAGDLLSNLNLGLKKNAATNDGMEPGYFVSEEDLGQPQMVYLAPSGEPVFMQEDGSMLYANGEDSGMSLADYEYV